MSDERYLSSKEIQAILRVSRARAYEIIRQMPRVKFGSSVRVAQSAFDQWVKERTVAPPPPTPTEARRMRSEARRRAFTTELDEKPIRLTRPRDRKPEPEGTFRIRPTRPRD